MTTPGLAKLLALALAVRLPSVLFARGYEFTDQQFQYVDPAWGVATGSDWWVTWDWKEGTRSWVYPGLLAGLMRALLATSLSDPKAMMVAIRGAHALVSLLPVAALWLYVTHIRPSPRPGLLTALGAASWVLVFTGVQPSGPTCAVGLTVTAVLLFEGKRLWPLGAGLCLGLAFCCRFQEALYGPALFGAGLLQRRWKAALLLCLGCVPPVVAQGLVDLWTWGSFLHSPFAYVDVQFLMDKATEYGTGTVWVYPGIVLAFLPFVPEAWRISRAGLSAMPVPCAMALVFLGLHMVPARRELRFVLSALALLQVAFVAGLVATAPRDALSLWYRRVMLGAHGLVLVLASVWYFHRGAIESALALRADPTYDGRLIAVGTQGEGIGGAYWLGRKRLELEYVPEREGLAEHLARRQLPWPVHVIIRRRPLTAAEAGTGFRCVLVAQTADFPELRESGRRFVYRVLPDPGR